MYRITKVLNHNTVLAVKDKSAREYLIVGKGVGFGKKITQSVEPTEDMVTHGISISGYMVQYVNAITPTHTYIIPVTT